MNDQNRPVILIPIPFHLTVDPNGDGNTYFLGVQSTAVGISLGAQKVGEFIANVGGGITLYDELTREQWTADVESIWRAYAVWSATRHVQPPKERTNATDQADNAVYVGIDGGGAELVVLGEGFGGWGEMPEALEVAEEYAGRMRAKLVKILDEHAARSLSLLSWSEAITLYVALKQYEANIPENLRQEENRANVARLLNVANILAVADLWGESREHYFIEKGEKSE